MVHVGCGGGIVGPLVGASRAGGLHARALTSQAGGAEAARPRGTVSYIVDAVPGDALQHAGQHAQPHALCTLNNYLLIDSSPHVIPVILSQTAPHVIPQVAPHAAACKHGSLRVQALRLHPAPQPAHCQPAGTACSRRLGILSQTAPHVASHVA
jgi:hypothetical protein